MSKTTTKNKDKAPKIPDPIATEEVNSYDEELNKRIVPSQPEGGEPEPQKSEDETAEDQLSDDALGVLADYVKAYPDNDVFHITSDGQVFLDRNKIDAVSHEKTLGGNLKSYTV